MKPEAPELLATHLTALSPLDGRYRPKLSTLSKYFSEYSLIHHRIKVELAIFTEFLVFTKEATLTKKQLKTIDAIVADFTHADAKRVKELEATTHHDVKAVEYFLKEKLTHTTLEPYLQFLHFGITSDDTNNLAYRLMVQGAHRSVMLPKLRQVLAALNDLAAQHAELPLLARTHGQPAIPTTLGKELSVFAMRLLRQLQNLEKHTLKGKLNGAVGGYQALRFCYPDLDWSAFSSQVTKKLGLDLELHTTQIAPPEDILELFCDYQRCNGILLDLAQDIWRYISDDWLVQKGKSDHVGSSTMPQKINPIEFENCEGNLTLANGLFDVFIRKLPTSRLQRDLSESTIARNYGVALGHSFLAYQSLLRGLATITPNHAKIHADLHENWNILSEAVQVLTRKQGSTSGYEATAAQFKAAEISQAQWRTITVKLDPTLHTLTPETYLGDAVQLTKQATKNSTNYLEDSDNAKTENNNRS